MTLFTCGAVFTSDRALWILDL